MDGVVVDYNTSALRWIEKDLEKKNLTTDEQWVFNDFYDDPRAAATRYHEQMKRQGWFQLSPTKKAPQLVKQLSEIGQVIFLTKATKINCAECSIGKIMWAANYFPGIICMPVLDKSAYATPDSILIDDALYQVQAFSKAGGKALLYETNYNSDQPFEKYSLERAKELCESIQEEFPVQVVSFSRRS